MYTAAVLEVWYTDTRNDWCWFYWLACFSFTPLIVPQLAMALADLALQMSAWDTMVPDLIQRFVVWI